MYKEELCVYLVFILYFEETFREAQENGNILDWRNSLRRVYSTNIGVRRAEATGNGESGFYHQRKIWLLTKCEKTKAII